MLVLAAGDKIDCGTYRLHSCFNRVINFVHPQTDCSSLLSFGKSDIPLAANHLQIDDDLFDRLKNEQEISITQGNLRGSDFSLPLPLNRVSACYHFTIDCPEHLQRRLDQLLRSLEGINSPYSLLPITQNNASYCPPNSFTRALHQRVNELIGQWTSRPHFLATIPSLKGLGIGLTPSGDDFIIGILAALDLMNEGHTLDIDRNQILELASSKNPYSQTFLNLAAQSLYSSHIGNFLTTFAGEQELKQSLDDVLLYGETSGADWLAGFISTLKRRTIWLPKV